MLGPLALVSILMDEHLCGEPGGGGGKGLNVHLGDRVAPAKKKNDTKVI